MKKFLFLASLLLFTVVMYASPPPDYLPDIVTEQSAYVIQDNAVISAPVTVEVQEVAFVYLGNFEQCSFVELVADPQYDIQMPALLVTDIICNAPGELNKPPSFYCNDRVEFHRNMQHSNYGYPLTGENC